MDYFVGLDVSLRTVAVCVIDTDGQHVFERIAAKDPDRQTAEIHFRIALINRFNALGTAKNIRVA